MSRSLSFWIPTFWAIVFIEPLSLLTPAAPDLNQPLLASESAFEVLLSTAR